MIILDTHAWLWWRNKSEQLTGHTRLLMESADLIGIIPAIGCWELAMLVEKRIGLSMDVAIWIDLALQHSRITLLPLTPDIAVLSTRLPDNFLVTRFFLDKQCWG